MSRLHFLNGLAGAAAAAVILLAGPARAGAVASYAEARAEAAARRVPVLIDFATDW